MHHPENLSPDEARHALEAGGAFIERALSRGASQALARGTVLQAAACAKAKLLGTSPPFPYRPCGLVFYEGFDRVGPGLVRVRPGPGRASSSRCPRSRGTSSGPSPCSATPPFPAGGASRPCSSRPGLIRGLLPLTPAVADALLVGVGATAPLSASEDGFLVGLDSDMAAIQAESVRYQYPSSPPQHTYAEARDRIGAIDREVRTAVKAECRSLALPDTVCGTLVDSTRVVLGSPDRADGDTYAPSCAPPATTP